MFDLIPFGRNERNLFNYLDNVERSFWDGSISNMAQFRCDVQDKGDSYLLEAELPGFEREDIGIDLDGFLEFNGNELLTGPGKISAEQAKHSMSR